MDSHHQSLSTGGAELAKLWPVLLEFLPLLKTRLEELRIILPKQQIPQHPALNTSTISCPWRSQDVFPALAEVAH